MDRSSKMDVRWKHRLKDLLSKLGQQQLTRSTQPRSPEPSRPLYVVSNRVVKCQGKERGYTVFGSNDYLGLATHPEIRTAAAETARIYGMGPRSSALIVGYTHLHERLEGKLAELMQKECAILFPTGTAANVSLLQALSEFSDVAIFSDALNHASIIDGTRLAARNGAEVNIYRHNDLAHLEDLVSSCHRRHKIVVTEALFSMDGDFADLKGLVALKARFGFLLVVDEAHAVLVAGDRGGGVSERDHVQTEVDIVVGTLSKAFGCLGGFVCCNAQFHPFLLTRCRGQMFSTSLPMPIVAAAITAIDVAQRETWRRKHLTELIKQISTQLEIQAESWIIPIVIGSAEDALCVSQELKDRGLLVPAIRPPTVPDGTCRLRISLSAAHTLKDVALLIRCIKTLQ